MSDKHVLNELSAYIDGEARHPDRIARHLQHCPDCARRHVQLLKLAAHLRALPQPEIRPGFVTRVLREVEMQEAHVPAWRLAWAIPTLAGAAAALLVLGLALYGSSLQETATPAEPRIAVVTPSPQQWTQEAMEAELARMIDAGEDISLFEPAGFAPAEPAEMRDIDIDDMVHVLADASGDIELPEVELDYEDLQATLESMSPGEWVNFHELLQEYLSEG